MLEKPEGLLLLDKPAGMTSFQCVQGVQRSLQAERAGHCGTLDPAARGLLLVLVGQATRYQDNFLALPKTYFFRAMLGVGTDTGDMQGKVMRTALFAHVTPEALRSAMSSFLGMTQQVPPKYAALKYKGKPYYEYARKGQDIPRAPRPVTITSFDLLEFFPPLWAARAVCSRGTYIRSLVEDVATRLETCSALAELVRERIGPYALAQALRWEDLERNPLTVLRAALLPADPASAAAYA